MRMGEDLAALEAGYAPSYELTRQAGLQALNCGYLRDPDDSFYRHQQNLIWRLLEDTPIGPESVVLDVGCGIGGPLSWIFERYQPRLAVGVEYCGSCVRTATELWADRSPRPHVVQGDAHRLPIESGSVDVILNCESALHYRDKDTFLRECRRVLRPDGHLCLGDITNRRPRFWAMVTRRARRPIFLWTAKQYLASLAANGFELLRHEEASQPISAAMHAGLAEIPAGRFPGVPGIRKRLLLLRSLQMLLRRRALTYDLFCARAR